MMMQTKPRRFYWPLLLCLTLTGALVGLFAFLIAEASPAGLVTVAKKIDTRPGGTSAMTVYLCGRVLYARTAPTPNAFDGEIALWTFVPVTFAIFAGAFAGALAAYGISQRLFRRNAPSVGTLLFLSQHPAERPTGRERQ